MRIFANLQDLWDYCLICPICKRADRKIDVSVGPDYVFHLNSFKKHNKSLDINCVFRNKHVQYLMEHKINCSDNTFVVNISELKTPIDYIYPDIAHKAYFYFYLQAHCSNDCSSTYTADLELDLLDKRVPSIKLEREAFFVNKDYQLSLFYDSNKMKIWPPCKCGPDIDCFHSVELDLVELDFSNMGKLLEKLKTYTIFS